MAKINNERLNSLYFKDRCQNLGDECKENNDCCLELICYSAEGMFLFYFLKYKKILLKESDKNRCLQSDKHVKRYADDFIIPPYYNPKNHLYPYGINMPPFPFYNAYEPKPSKSHQRNKMGNLKKKLKYFHFRFFSKIIS
jgi:hypothetical protein